MVYDRNGGKGGPQERREEGTTNLEVENAAGMMTPVRPRRGLPCRSGLAYERDCQVVLARAFFPLLSSPRTRRKMHRPNPRGRVHFGAAFPSAPSLPQVTPS